MIFGQRVEQAREFRCLTQTELAERIGVQQTAIARLESGSLAISDAKAAEIAEVLSFPLSFFERDVQEFFPMGTLQFRTTSDTPAKERKRAHHYASLVFEITSELTRKLKMPAMRLPRLAGSPEDAANLLRSELAVSPSTPIRNLTSILERAGVFVFSLPDLRAGCDGFSVWGAVDRKLIPAIYVTADALGDRARHTLAHEIGELTLEDMPAGRAREVSASLFAAAFLMPADALKRDLVPPVDMTDFVEIKSRYGVSIQSAIMRARHLELISHRKYQSLFRDLTARGWRKREPEELDVPREKPRALHKMAELLYGDPVDLRRLADDVRVDPWLLKQLLAAHASKAELSGHAPQVGASVVSLESRFSSGRKQHDAIRA